MATITVTNLNDTGPGSLRNALGIAELQGGTDTIAFAAGLTGKTIVLTSGPLAITAGAVIIDGDRNNDGVADITLSGGHRSSILSVADGANATVDGVVFADGFDRPTELSADAAGAIRNAGTLAVKNSLFIANRAYGASGDNSDGGDAATILNVGTLSVSATRFEANAAYGGAGSPGDDGVSGPSAYGKSGGDGGHAAGGILGETFGSVSVSGVSFVDNQATGGLGGDGGNAYGGSSSGSPGGPGGAGGSISFGILTEGGRVVGTATVSGGGGAVGQGGDPGRGDVFATPNGAALSGHLAPLLLVIGYAGVATDTAGFRGPQSIYNDGAGATLTGGLGADRIFGGDDVDRLVGADGDVMNGGGGNDTVVVTHISRTTSADGGGRYSYDSLDLSQAQAVTGVYDIQESFFTTSAGGFFRNFRNIVGTAGDEQMLGTDGVEIFNGGGGNDTLTSKGGGDTLIGGPGDDTFIDEFDPSTIVEAANGGNDTLVAARNVNLADYANVENVTLADFDNYDAIGSAVGNRLTGNDGFNELIGLGGNDTLAGGGGPDRLEGGDGNDTYSNPVLAEGDEIVEAAGAAAGLHDRIVTISSFNLATVANVEDIVLAGGRAINAIGNNLANLLTGNPGNNTILGGGGADTITGAAGNDSMNGGVGADLFVFAAGSGADRIDGFETALDKFDLPGATTFSARTESGGNTTLTHTGGTILIAGVTGLSLTEWRGLVVNGARETSAHDDIAAHREPADAPLGHFGAADFLYA